jgi:hypothetical protein
MGAGVSGVDVASAWRAAVEVVAAAAGIDPDAIRGEGIRRGPRPSEAAREPKKIAIALAVTLSERSYASLARHVGLHKDTVCSHCADIRKACDDDVFEQRFEALLILARARVCGRQREPGAREDADLRTLMRAVLARLERIECRLIGLDLQSDNDGLTAPQSDAPAPIADFFSARRRAG